METAGGRPPAAHPLGPHLSGGAQVVQDPKGHKGALSGLCPSPALTELPSPRLVKEGEGPAAPDTVLFALGFSRPLWGPGCRKV